MRHFPVGETWHPNSVGPVVCLNAAPDLDMPQDITSVRTLLTTPAGAPRLELAGHSLLRAVYATGQYVPLTLFWRALNDVPEDWSVSLRILDERGNVVWSEDIAAPVIGMYPTSRWIDGEVVADYHELAVPPDMPPADYQWAVVVYRQAKDGKFEQLRDGHGNTQIPGGTFTVVRGTDRIPHADELLPARADRKAPVSPRGGDGETGEFRPVADLPHERPVAQIRQRLQDLLARVHDEGAIAGDRLAERRT